MAHRWRSPSASSIYPCWLSRSRPHCAPPACPQLKPCAWSTEMRPSVDDHIVQARRLRKVYRGANEVEALRGIDLEVERGEMVAIVGPSGSGKTTLLNCLSGLDAFDGGQVVVDGQDLSTMSDRTRTAYRRDHMGFVFQAFNLLPVLSAVENVEDRKSTRLNSSHPSISYAVFCLKKKKKITTCYRIRNTKERQKLS